jgi:hypothetical protein
MFLQNVISGKSLLKKLFFVDILKVNDESSRIWIHYSEAWIRGSGSHQNVMDPEHWLGESAYIHRQSATDQSHPA